MKSRGELHVPSVRGCLFVKCLTNCSTIRDLRTVLFRLHGLTTLDVYRYP